MQLPPLSLSPPLSFPLALYSLTPFFPFPSLFSSFSHSLSPAPLRFPLPRPSLSFSFPLFFSFSSPFPLSYSPPSSPCFPSLSSLLPPHFPLSLPPLNIRLFQLVLVLLQDGHRQDWKLSPTLLSSLTVKQTANQSLRGKETTVRYCMYTSLLLIRYCVSH